MGYFVNVREHPPVGIDCRSVYERLLGGKMINEDKAVEIYDTRDLYPRKDWPHNISREWIFADAKKRTLCVMSISYVHRRQFDDYISWHHPNRSYRRIPVDQLLGMPLHEISYVWSSWGLGQLGIDPVGEELRTVC